MNTKTTKSWKEFYAEKGNYGEEGRFIDGAQDRLRKMTEMSLNLKYTPQNILDIGCGTGYFSHLLKVMYPKATVYGVDISGPAITAGKQKYKDVVFVQADAEIELPFANNTFDLVVSGEYVEHIVDIDRNFSEVNRVTKKGGVFIITTPNLTSWLNRILVLFGKWPYYTEQSFRKTIPMFSLFGYTFPNTSKLPTAHLRLFTVEGLSKLLAIHKFKASKVYGSPYLEKYRSVIKLADIFFAKIPSFASGLIVSATKTDS